MTGEMKEELVESSRKIESEMDNPIIEKEKDILTNEKLENVPPSEDVQPVIDENDDKFYENLLEGDYPFTIRIVTNPTNKMIQQQQNYLKFVDENREKKHKRNGKFSISDAELKELDVIEIPVTTYELVQELHQNIMDREDVCHRTNFSLILHTSQIPEEYDDPKYLMDQQKLQETEKTREINKFEPGRPLDAFTEVRSALPEQLVQKIQMNNSLLVQQSLSMVTSSSLDNNKKENGVQQMNELVEIKPLLIMIDEQFTMRTVRIHLKHFQELITTTDYFEHCSIQGYYCGKSISYADSIAKESNMEKSLKNKKKSSSPTNKSNENLINENHQNGLNDDEYNLKLLHPNFSKSPPCLISIKISEYNPVSPFRKLQGDLLYLIAETLEKKEFHITANVRGFFLNESTNRQFRHTSTNNSIYQSIVTLLDNISPLFKERYRILQEERIGIHSYERIISPFCTIPWCIRKCDSESNNICRFSDALGCSGWKSAGSYTDDQFPSPNRDWNDEFQSTRELPMSTTSERILRDRAKFKVMTDFSNAACFGAQAAVEGNLMAINPGEDRKIQMFIWNNMFFSFGFDVKRHYEDLGGDAAAYVASANDYNGVNAIESEIEELRIKGKPCIGTSGTIIIDYYGMRVTVQTIIPGILEREQDNSVVYGSSDFGKTVNSSIAVRPKENEPNEETQERMYYCEKYEMILKGVSESLFLRPHLIVDDKGIQHQFYTSIECKGVLGNDRRMYLLDMMRTFPIDANCISCNVDCVNVFNDDELYEKEFTLGMKEELSSIEHSLPLFRLSLIRRFNTDKEEQMKRIIKEKNISMNEAAKLCGSLSEEKWLMQFNSDALQKDKHIVKCVEDENNLRRLGRYLRRKIINELLMNMTTDTHSLPLDNYELVVEMQKRGINLRYLGDIIDRLNVQTNSNISQFLKSMCLFELLCRAAKRIFVRWIRSVSATDTAAAISLFLNSLFGLQNRSNGNENDHHHQQQQQQQHNGHNKKNYKNKKNRSNYQHNDSCERNLYFTSTIVSNDWKKLNVLQLYKMISKDIQTHFNFDLSKLFDGIPDNSRDVMTLLELNEIPSVAFLRRFSILTGIQIIGKSYDFSSSSIFTVNDIIAILPKPRWPDVTCTDGLAFYRAGLMKLKEVAKPSPVNENDETSASNSIVQQLHTLRVAFTLLQKSYNCMTQVYGILHPLIASVLTHIAQLRYLFHDHMEAWNVQYKAVIVAERTYGIDHIFTCRSYLLFSLYSFSSGKFDQAISLAKRSRLIFLHLSGKHHPFLNVIDASIAVIYQINGEMDQSVHLLQKVLKSKKHFYGDQSPFVAFIARILSRTYAFSADYKLALQHEKDANRIYTQLLGEDHEKTKESFLILKDLTKHAVDFQRKLKQFSEKKNTKNFLETFKQTPQPMFVELVDLLNVINEMHLFKQQ
ncbi:hypothetical protein SNEBB_009093 [Seison nebaliae]|nr:hypothetical protein SNEBB_009093 [Seison nebaliae]